MEFAQKTSGLFNSMDGRDKFCKSIQYLSRLIVWGTKGTNPETAEKFDKLFKQMADARKLFRLFKWVNEYQKIVDMLGKPELGWDEIDLIINILTRLGFVMFWIFDNQFILSKIKFIGGNVDTFKKGAMTGWWIGLTWNILYSLKQLKKLAKEQGDLVKASSNSSNKEAFKARFKQVSEKRNKAYRTLIKCFGDWIVSGTGSGIWPKIGINFNEGVMALGGSVSGVIATWENFK